MSHTQPHTRRQTRAPRAYRDAQPLHVQRRSIREAWRADDEDAGEPKAEFVSAQTVFLVARGLALLLAAIAVGLGGTPGQPDTSSATPPPPTSPHATTR
ncbi:hypothetical protein [Ralstonia sp. UBA689]|uniref:hypothetical protein n=1 Tax=Ralstonia sp. UBA689 TaxID=1947373 RepID=UPI0025E3FDC0|nr:hypothetical protein [Ralstonia sp. UBA689]